MYSPACARSNRQSGRLQWASAPVIEARGVGLTFRTADGPVTALTGVDLSIQRGEFVSFIGPSGCGKTTFLRAVAALETPTEGTLTVNGMSPDAARQARAYGYVFQAAGLYPWRTIAGNVKLPLEILGFSKADQDARVRKGLSLVELDGFAGKFPWANLFNKDGLPAQPFRTDTWDLAPAPVPVKPKFPPKDPAKK